MDTTTLKQTFTGDVILPGDEAYEKAGSSPFFKGAPAVVVQPKTTKDITTAITFARDNKLQFSIRSGGHSVAGFSTNDGGMVISMIHFNQIEVVDAEKGLVRIGAGAVWGDVAKTLQSHSFALSSGDTKSVGVGGLTLGGGIGWMVRQYGLAIDSLVGAEIVTADGKVLHVSASENPDLFWAIRGGGGNFGIVTYFEFKAHKVEKVYAGMAMFSLDNLKEMLQKWSSYMRTAPEQLTTTFMIMPEFMGNPPGAMLVVCYNGSEGDGKKAVEPLLQIGKVTMQNISVKEYADVLEEGHPPEGIKVIVNNAFVKEMNEEVIEILSSSTGKPGTPFVQIRALGGAMAKVANDATAFPHRKSEVMMLVPTFVPVDATEEMQTKALETWHKIEKFSQGTYSSFISDPKAAVSAIYPAETYTRLLEVKRKYDPENIFNQNFNII